MGFTIETGISSAAVFAQGLLSFLSPCVLPLLPLYLGYLAGGISKTDSRLRLFARVLMFALGISSAFFVLGLGASAAGRFFSGQRMLFVRAGGLLIILFGLYQLGVFGNLKFLNREHRIPLRLEKMTMSPAAAFLMGFAFSFAWTPCVGPALASVLLMAGSAKTEAAGFFLIGVYTIGFILPLLAAGVFTAQLTEFFRKHGKAVKYTVKAGGILMILTGAVMLTGVMNHITGYLSAPGSAAVSDDSGNGTDEETDGTDRKEKEEEETEGSASQKAPLSDLELTDQYGNIHRLEDYRGRVIFLNFWATWCGPCRNELPDIQKLYEEYQAQGDEAEAVILGVAGPGIGQEGSRDDIAAFMEENGYTYPVLMDDGGKMFTEYGIQAFPTTFMIDREGNIFGYVTGQMTEDIMKSIISQTVEG